jgi:hypothetical protein
MAKRYVKFNVQALQQIASQALRSRCVELRKLPEGLYNKVLSLRMENGKKFSQGYLIQMLVTHIMSLLAEVATLDFVCGSMYSFELV